MTQALCRCPTCGSPLPSDLFAFDRDAGIVVAGGNFVQLPRREANILEVLLDRRGRVVSKSALFAKVYAGDEPETENVVESHVSKLRKKVLPLGIVISSERFKGYTLTIGAKS